MAHDNTFLTDERDRADSDTHVTRWSDGGTPAASIVEAVAAVTDSSPTSLRPLYDTIDPDALNRLVESDAGGSSGCQVSFRFEGCAVTVHGDGRTVVAPATDCEH